MNAEFVNIKVDREERADLDEIYMTATQILAGQGGWPNSVFLTTDLKPFFAGTYFPPIETGGMPGFPTVLKSMIHAWKSAEPTSRARAKSSRRAIRRHLAELEPFAGPLSGGARPSAGSRRCGRGSTAPGAASAARPSSRRRPTSSSCSISRRVLGRREGFAPNAEAARC